MNWECAIFVPPHVVHRSVGDEFVVLDLVSGTYFTLDPVGAKIWQLLVDGNTLLAVRDKILNEYEVSFEALELDMIRLVGELEEKRLICLSSTQV